DRPTASEAQKIAEDVRRKLPQGQIQEISQRLRENFETGQYFKTEGLVSIGIRDVLFDMAMEDPNIKHRPADANLATLEEKLEQYALNEACRHKYAGMARG